MTPVSFSRGVLELQRIADAKRTPRSRPANFPPRLPPVTKK